MNIGPDRRYSERENKKYLLFRFKFRNFKQSKYRKEKGEKLQRKAK